LLWGRNWPRWWYVWWRVHGVYDTPAVRLPLAHPLPHVDVVVGPHLKPHIDFFDSSACFAFTRLSPLRYRRPATASGGRTPPKYGVPRHQSPRYRFQPWGRCVGLLGGLSIANVRCRGACRRGTYTLKDLVGVSECSWRRCWRHFLRSSK